MRKLTTMSMPERATRVYKAKGAIHGGSDNKGFVVVPTSYQIDFEAQCSISIVNKGQLYFCIHNCTSISCVSFSFLFYFNNNNFFIDILGYECCATCLLRLCDLNMLNFL